MIVQLLMQLRSCFAAVGILDFAGLPNLLLFGFAQPPAPAAVLEQRAKTLGNGFNLDLGKYISGIRII